MVAKPPRRRARGIETLVSRFGVRNVALAGILVAFALAAAWWSFGRGQQVNVLLAQTGDAAQVVYATGTVEPVHWAKITAPQRKRIVELCKCEGEPVRAGDVLARLDDGEERAVLRELKARLARLRADVERIAKLVERSITSRTTLDEKRTQVREYEARVAAQDDRIADLALKSPMNGVVLRRDGEVGEIAGTGADAALLWVGRPRPLQVVAEVNEDDIVKVRPGQKVLLRHEGHERGPLKATVARVTPKGDPDTKTFRAYLELPDDTPLMIGMSVEANIVVREAKAAVLLPAEAIVNGSVQVAEDDRAVRRRVESRDSRYPADRGSRGVGRRRNGALALQAGSARWGPRSFRSCQFTMRLILDIAFTHVFTRVRQTLVGMLGVAMGVGFSIMMAALMDGSQRDFIAQLVDSLPHVTVRDERRKAPRQPVEDVYAACRILGTTHAGDAAWHQKPLRHHCNA